MLRIVLFTFVFGYVAEAGILMDGICPLVEDGTCPDNEYMYFSLYTRANPTTGQILDMASDNITMSNFNIANPTKIIIHGFMSSEFETYLTDIRTAYLIKGEYNVIMVNWEKLGPFVTCYVPAVKNIRHVGNCTGQLIQRIRQLGVTDIHVIGHSLGAQTTNFVAQNVSPSLPRITGLDPAAPLYHGRKSDTEQLDKSDADFVDIIHTDSFVLGKIEQCGHVDFYVNGGTFQPGCGIDIVACPHIRSCNYFAESINSATGFYGNQCESFAGFLLNFCPDNKKLTILMGEDVLRTSTGVVVVPTNSESPFAIGKL